MARRFWTAHLGGTQTLFCRTCQLRYDREDYLFHCGRDIALADRVFCTYASE